MNSIEQQTLPSKWSDIKAFSCTEFTRESDLDESYLLPILEPDQIEIYSTLIKKIESTERAIRIKIYFDSYHGADYLESVSDPFPKISLDTVTGPLWIAAGVGMAISTMRAAVIGMEQPQILNRFIAGLPETKDRISFEAVDKAARLLKGKAPYTHPESLMNICAQSGAMRPETRKKLEEIFADVCGAELKTPAFPSQKAPPALN